MKKFLLTVAVILMTVFPAVADEGMWLPSLIGTRIKDMKSKGFRLSAEDIYSINQASLKDAIVLFGRGCTGELVSAEGLLLTNHHCGYGQIQQHSSVDHDYLTHGFWAMNRAEELPNPGLTVSFLVSMEDVTARATNGVTPGMDNAERNEIINKNRKEIADEAREDGRYSASVESLYYGNQYFLFVYEVFRDIRLVGAPPSSIGKFGGDTDNWMWPRHTGDFSVFRIYADKDNRPAEYSPENMPYESKKYFTISTKGVKEGDFTFVYGFPGTTREYVTSDFIDYTLNYSNPDKIKLRTMRLDIIKAAQDRDPAVRIMYASKAANIANAWKKWQGESLGLARLGTLERKRAYESDFDLWAAGKPEYSEVLNNIHGAYAELLPYAMAADYYNEAFRAIELVAPVTYAIRGVKSEGAYEAFYKDYSPVIDRQIAKKVMAQYIEVVPEKFIPERFAAHMVNSGGIDKYIDEMFDNSIFATKEGVMELLLLEGEEFDNALSQDPAVKFANGFMNVYSEVIAGEYNRLNSKITALYHTYMRGQMEFEKDTDFYPDANLTLRVAYGEVAGYHAADGVYHRYMTTLDGTMEKDDPEIYDYDVPQRLREIYYTKDYGRWGVNIGTKKEPYYTIPVAFLATNHTTGGNSGSPLLNGKGELLGINFDRTWLSTMSDLEFDPEICRNISVDIRYVLFVIDKIGGAGYLFDEMVLR